MLQANGGFSAAGKPSWFCNPTRDKRNRAAALLFVLAVHGAVAYGLWSMRVMSSPSAPAPLFVSLIPSQPRPQPVSQPAQRVTPHVRPVVPAKPRPDKHEAEQPVVSHPAPLAAPAQANSPLEATSPPPAPGPAIPAAETGPPASRALPAEAEGPVALASDLAVVCAARTPPSYPVISRRLGESGRVVLRVELDAAGRVSNAQLTRSSGYTRLDAAAVEAVMKWRCQPAQRNGQPVRSVAVQPFDFTLEGY